MNGSDLLVNLDEHGKQRTLKESKPVYVQGHRLPTTRSSFILVPTPQWGQLGDDHHLALVLQRDAGPSPSSRKWILTALSMCSQPSALASVIGRCPGEGSFFFSFHRSHLGGAVFSHWTGIPSLLLAATLWPRGETVLK